MEDKQPVYDDLFDVAAEQCVIGSIMLSEEAADKACVQLDTADFYAEKHKIIFAAIFDLYTAGTKIDIVTLVEKLGKAGLESAGGLPYITETSASIPTTANAQSYIDIVIDKSRRRSVLKGLQEAAKVLRTGGNDYTEIAQNAIDGAAPTSGGGIEEAKNVFVKAYEAFGRKKESGLSTGFVGIDDITYGFRRKDLIVLAARPSIGKTTLALNIATNFALKGRTVVYFTLESSNVNVAKRQLCYASKVSEDEYQNMDGESVERFIEAYASLVQSKMYFSEYTGTTQGIKADCQKVMRKETAIDLIVIDYLSIMDIPEKKNSNQAAAIGDITRKLKLLAKDTDAPVLLLAQLRRDIEKRRDPTPILSDLKDSGSIEQDADVVIFIDRKRDEEKTRVIVAKQRDGRLGTADMIFDGATYSFYDADIPQE